MCKYFLFHFELFWQLKKLNQNLLQFPTFLGGHIHFERIAITLIH